MSEVGIGPTTITKTVAAAGTRVQVSTSDLFCSAVFFECDNTGTGPIYVGDVTVVSTKYMTRLVKGNTGIWIMPGAFGARPQGGLINLKNFYLDAGASGDKCQVTYFQRVG